MGPKKTQARESSGRFVSSQQNLEEEIDQIDLEPKIEASKKA